MKKAIIFLLLFLCFTKIGMVSSIHETFVKRIKVPTLKEYERRMKMSRRWQYDSSGYQQGLLLLGGNIERNPGMSSSLFCYANKCARMIHINNIAIRNLHERSILSNWLLNIWSHIREWYFSITISKLCKHSISFPNHSIFLHAYYICLTSKPLLDVLKREEKVLYF